MGFAVMLKLPACPAQLLATGVTVIVATTGAGPVFETAKAAISPMPLAARPMEVALFVQLYTVPLTVPEKVMGLTIMPWHND